MNGTIRHTIYAAFAATSLLLVIGALVLWGFSRGVGEQKTAPVTEKK